jgi:hypothetical protein
VRHDLLGPLSAVRSISGIDAKQAAQLEAIGYALDTVDAVYQRLVESIKEGLPESDVLAFADAWSIVDWMQRLDRLVSRCPGLPQRQPEVKAFRESSSLVKNLRHIYQHPEDEIAGVTVSRRSLWGHLSWQRRVAGGHEIMTITPFGRWDGEYDPTSEYEQPPRTEVDRISLFSPDGEVEIGLTGQHEAVVRFASQLDAAVQVARRDARPGIRLDLKTWLPGAGR